MQRVGVRANGLKDVCDDHLSNASDNKNHFISTPATLQGYYHTFKLFISLISKECVFDPRSNGLTQARAHTTFLFPLDCSSIVQISLYSYTRLVIRPTVKFDVILKWCKASIVRSAFLNVFSVTPPLSLSLFIPMPLFTGTFLQSLVLVVTQ